MKLICRKTVSLVLLLNLLVRLGGLPGLILCVGEGTLAHIETVYNICCNKPPNPFTAFKTGNSQPERVGTRTFDEERCCVSCTDVPISVSAFDHKYNPIRK